MIGKILKGPAYNKQAYLELLGMQFAMYFDLLHMHAGLLVFFTAFVAFRDFGSTVLPVICVIAVEIVLLWSGLTGEESRGRLSLNSFLSAIIWPFAIVVLGRLLTNHQANLVVNKATNVAACAHSPHPSHRLR